MGIFKAIGLGLALIMLKFLVPRVFVGAEDTLLALFDTLQHLLSMSESSTAKVPDIFSR